MFYVLITTYKIIQNFLKPQKSLLTMSKKINNVVKTHEKNNQEILIDFILKN